MENTADPYQTMYAALNTEFGAEGAAIVALVLRNAAEKTYLSNLSHSIAETQTYGTRTKRRMLLQTLEDVVAFGEDRIGYAQHTIMRDVHHAFTTKSDTKRALRHGIGTYFFAVADAAHPDKQYCHHQEQMFRRRVTLNQD